MVRVCRRSSIALSPPLIHDVPRGTVLRVISKHRIHLQDKLSPIDQLKREVSLRPGQLPGLDERELLRSGPSVAHQIAGLDKLKEEIESKSTENPPLSIINKQLQHLHEEHAFISQLEEYICQGGSLEIWQLNVLRSKPEVVHQIDVLDKIFKESSLVQHCLSGAEQGREAVEYQLNHPLSKSGFAEILTFGSLQAEVSVKSVRNVEFRPSMNENETTRHVVNLAKSEPVDKLRYLCVTNGCEILYLDLKQSKDQCFSNAEDVPLLPKIATLNLLEEGLPVTMGLFKWRSDAYMIGGQKLPAALEGKPDPWCVSRWGENPQGFRLYRTLCWTHKVKATSRSIHCLSLADSATVSYSKSKTIGKLKKPKLWPIVEEINGQIHVIDSLPHLSWPGLHWTFSHEVFNRDTGRWIEEIPTRMEDFQQEIPTVIPEDGSKKSQKVWKKPQLDFYYIRSHSLVGDRIYAVGVGRETLVFDSNNKKWEAHPKLNHNSMVRDVWHILDRGHARCVGRFPYDGEPPLYVLIALQADRSNDDFGTHAAAYLVTSTGQILCIQRLLHFFKGPVWPCYMVQGRIIQVDKETMCSILTGSPCDKCDSFDWVFINSFTVEMLTDAAAPKVRQLLANGREDWRPVKQQEFVRVDIKDSYIYKTDPKLEAAGGGSGNWVGVQACFL